MKRLDTQRRGGSAKLMMEEKAAQEGISLELRVNEGGGEEGRPDRRRCLRDKESGEKSGIKSQVNSFDRLIIIFM